MAPPRYGESEFHVKDMGDGGFRSTSSVGANHLLTVGAWRVCGVIISRLLATTRRGFELRRIDVRVLIFGDFRLICESRSHRTSKLGQTRWFLVKIDDFPVSVRRVRWKCTRLSCLHVIFVDLWSITKEIPPRGDHGPRFREKCDDFPVSLWSGPWAHRMSPALTNRPWRLIFTKNRNIFGRVRAKARAASVRHRTVYI